MKNRNQTIDLLRNITILLLVPFHSAMIFAPQGVWHIRSSEGLILARWITIGLSVWMMPLLMFLAGISMRYSLQKRDDFAFIKERSFRLLVPLITGVLLLIPPQVYLERISPPQPGRIKKDFFSGSFFDFYPTFFRCCYPEGNLSYHHLWFLFYLFIYSILLLPIFRLLLEKRRIANTDPFHTVDLIRVGFFLFVIELIFRPFFPNWQNFISDHANHMHYIFLIIFGFFTWHDRSMIQFAKKNGTSLLGIAAVLLAILISLYDFYPGKTRPEDAIDAFLLGGPFADWLLPMVSHTTTTLVRTFAEILILIGLPGLFTHRSPGMERFNGFFSPISMPFYLFHQTLVVFFGWLILRTPFHPLLHWLSILLLSVAGSLLLSVAIRKLPGIPALFGTTGTKPGPALKKHFILFVILLTFPVLTGCSFRFAGRILSRGNADPSDMNFFPARTIPASSQAIPLKESTAEQNNDIDKRFVEIIHSIPDLDSNPSNLPDFLEATSSRAFLVLEGDRVLYEWYGKGLNQKSLHTSFSVAKSILSILIGIAVEKGIIPSLDNPVTPYLPELSNREGFQKVRIIDLLHMSSGLRYSGFRDDALTYYYPDLRSVTLEEVEMVGNPDMVFEYNNWHPLLLGMILERASGMTVSQFTSRFLWQPMGARENASWSMDSLESGFEKMESGFNATARDFARFGLLLLNRGEGNQGRVISHDWIVASTSPRRVGDHNYYKIYSDYYMFNRVEGYYNRMWWGIKKESGYHFTALGNHGQYVFVCPEKKKVIVRLGEVYGIQEWPLIFTRFCDIY